MADETRSFDSSGAADQAAELGKRVQEMMANYFDWLQHATSAGGSTNLNSRLLNYTTLNSRLLNYATEHVNAASTLISKLSRAADLQEVVKIQMEFVQTQMTMFNTRTKKIDDAVAAAGNLVGSFVSLLSWQKVLQDLARNSPKYTQTSGDDRMRTWSAVPPHEGHPPRERR
jgi:hypothetical protein